MSFEAKGPADWPLRLGRGRLAQGAGRLASVIGLCEPHWTSHFKAISPKGAGVKNEFEENWQFFRAVAIIPWQMVGH